MNVTLSSIYIYPVKSLAGIECTQSHVDNMGLKWDRRWMLIDDQGKFLSARKHPSLSTIQPHIDEHGQLSLTFPSGAHHLVPLHSDDSREVQATVWDDTVKAFQLSDAIDQQLSQFIGQSSRLVFIDQTTERQVDLQYAKPGDRTGFADGFPLLLISEASLEDLNSRMETPLSMKRFRPNLVVKGCAPYAEDQWHSLSDAQLELLLVKPCSRCIMTTVDPLSGQRTGNEPLATLKTYRQLGNEVMFGQNVIHQQQGHLTVGQTLKVHQLT